GLTRAQTYFVVPTHRVKDFIGREEELRQIGSYFHHPVERPRILVLHAMGGQGKSQIALEYCRQAQQIYRAVFWIDSSSASTTVQSLVSIAQELDGSVVNALDDDDAKVRFALRMLERWDDRWLMVFDKCDDPATFSNVEQFVPQ
ncbi:hypothetical protein LTR47_012124, partial [Exophiala xenobiotica]